MAPNPISINAQVEGLQGSELGLTRMTACGGYDSLGGDD